MTLRPVVQILIIKTALDSLSLMKQINLENVLLVALLTCEASLKIGQHLGVLLDLHFDLFVSSFEDLESLATDSKDVTLGPGTDCHAL